MIFETLSYTSNAGVTLAIGDLTYPAINFKMKTFQSNEPIKKMQYPGRWPTFSYPEFREIHVAGDILGDDASDFNDKKRALNACIQPPYGRYNTARRHGRVDLTFYGDANTYYAYVILGELDTETEALYPSVGPYSITWTSFEPYLFNASTNTPTTSY